MDLGEGLDGPSDWAIAAFHALFGGQVDIGLLGKLAGRVLRRPLVPPSPATGGAIWGLYASVSFPCLARRGKECRTRNKKDILRGTVNKKLIDIKKFKCYSITIISILN